MPFSLKEPGLPISAGLHATLAVVGLLSFGQPQPFQDAAEALPVDVISESQFSEMTRGEKSAREVVPNQQPRVDRVAPKVEENPAGAAPRQVDAPPRRQERQEETAPEDRPRSTAAVAPPPPPVVPPARPPEPAPATPRTAAPVRPAAPEEEDDEAEEAVRQRQVKPPPRPEPPKPDQAALARLLEQQKQDEQKKQDEAKRRDEQRRQEEARKQAEQKQREEERAAVAAKLAEDRKKAEEEAKKAAERKRRQEEQKAADAQRQATLDAVRQRLALNREAPANAGSSGAQVAPSRPSAGTATGNAQRLSPSDRDALLGMIGDQIRSCWSLPPVGKPRPLPQVRMTLNPDGSLSGAPSLINASSDPNFRPVAESGMRAIRQCAPFRIPARFQPMFESWRSITVQMNPDDL
jgi:colicin import membrane protein